MLLLCFGQNAKRGNSSLVKAQPSPCCTPRILQAPFLPHISHAASSALRQRGGHSPSSVPSVHFPTASSQFSSAFSGLGFNVLLISSFSWTTASKIVNHLPPMHLPAFSFSSHSPSSICVAYRLFPQLESELHSTRSLSPFPLTRSSGNIWCLLWAELCLLKFIGQSPKPQCLRMRPYWRCGL